MIFIDEQIPLLDDFRALDPNLITFRGRTLTRERLIEHGATHLIVRSTTRVNKELLDGTQVRFVGSATAGTDHVDLDFLSSRFIEFSSAPGSNADAVADYVREAMSLVPFSLSIFPSSLSKSLQVSSSALSSLVIGVVGFGNVGRRVARIAESLGMNVLISDPPLGMNTPLHELLQLADVVTLHVPLTTTGLHPTYRIIDEEQIALLKQGAMVINTSRGDVVNEQMLVRAHAEGNITCVLDVFTNEPNINSATVEAVELVTPHIAGYTRQAKLNGAIAVLDATRSDMMRREATSISEHLQVPSISPSDSEHLRVPSRLELIAKRFKSEWLKSPTPETFDRIRQESLDM